MNRNLLKLAVPNIISNLSVPLLSSVDTALMGHLSTAYLSALGVGGMVFMFLYFIFGFLRMGTTSFISQAYGSKRYRDLTLTLYRALILAIFIAFFIILLESLILNLSKYFMNIEDNIYPYFKEYFSIRIYSAPAVMVIYVLIGFFFGVQNTKYPLFITLVVNIANLLISIYLVKYLNMGIAGVAIGTLVAQYMGAFFGFFLLMKYKSYLFKPSSKEIFQKDKLLNFFHINTNIFIRTILLMFALAFFYSQASKAGEEILSIMVLLLQFMIWFSFIVDGFANATESLVGKFFGANDKNSIFYAIKLSTIWSSLMATIFAICYYFFMEEILFLFTDEQYIIQTTLSLTILVAIFPIISFLAFVYDGVFIGLGAVKVMRDILFLSTFLYILSFFVLKSFLEIKVAIWGSFILFFLFRSFFSVFIFRKKLSKKYFQN